MIEAKRKALEARSAILQDLAVQGWKPSATNGTSDTVLMSKDEESFFVFTRACTPSLHWGRMEFDVMLSENRYLELESLRAMSGINVVLAFWDPNLGGIGVVSLGILANGKVRRNNLSSVDGVTLYIPMEFLVWTGKDPMVSLESCRKHHRPR